MITLVIGKQFLSVMDVCVCARNWKVNSKRIDVQLARSQKVPDEGAPNYTKEFCQKVPCDRCPV